MCRWGRPRTNISCSPGNTTYDANFDNFYLQNGNAFCRTAGVPIFAANSFSPSITSSARHYGPKYLEQKLWLTSGGGEMFPMGPAVIDLQPVLVHHLLRRRRIDHY